MRISSFYPVFVVEDVAGASLFFQSHFGFQPAFESDWYVHLSRLDREDTHLAFLQVGHPTIPVQGVPPCSGVLINFEVEDVDEEWRRLSEAGLQVLLPLRDEPFGQRHFIVKGPEGLMVDLITPIPPSLEFADQYSEFALPG